jgi:hypothetical protein
MNVSQPIGRIEGEKSRYLLSDTGDSGKIRFETKESSHCDRQMLDLLR